MHDEADEALLGLEDEVIYGQAERDTASMLFEQHMVAQQDNEAE